MYRPLTLFILVITFGLSSTASATTPVKGAEAAKDEQVRGSEAKAASWDVAQPEVSSRMQEIDVRQGTWMSLDVSPDGTQLVFDLLGDLYVLPIEGGEAKALTTSLAWDMQPRYSPDGRWLAFTSDKGGADNIWVMPAEGGDPVQITKEDYRLLNSPAWSPDSLYIVARKHFTSRRSLGSGEMWLYHRTGGKGVQMTKKKTKQKDEGEPVFSPDGRYLYYSRDVSPGETFRYGKNSAEGIYAIERLNRETGRVIRIAGGPGGAARPTPSPDGKWLAFVRRYEGRTGLVIKDLSSGAERLLLHPIERDLQETWAIHGVYPTFAWTPDSASLVLWSKGTLHRVRLSDGVREDIPFHVKTTRRMLTPLRHQVEVAPDRVQARMLRWVRVSPNGKQAVYHALGHLYIQDLPLGKARRLTRQNDHWELYPAFSADGRHVVYTTWDDQALGSVRMVSTRGGKGKVISREPGHYISPVLSPDGRYVVFQRVGGGWLTSPRWAEKKGLFALPVSKKGAETRISHTGSDAHFGAQSDRVFFLDKVAKQERELRSARLDGHELRHHVVSAEAMSFRVSPDERWIAWQEGYHVWVSPFVSAGRTWRLGPKEKGLPRVRVSKDSGYNMAWSGDSKRLHWNLGPELFTRTLGDDFTKAGEGESADSALQAHTLGFSFAHDRPSGGLALVGARLVTMEGDEIIEDGTLVIAGNRIQALGPRDTTTVPKGFKVIDVKGMTAIPGLIDVHDHGSQAEFGITPERNWQHDATLAFGVTTIHDPSNHSQSIFAARELIQAGLMTGPRTFSTGTILYGAEGAFRSRVNSLEDARQHLSRMQAMGAFSVKSYNQPRRNQRQQVLQAARELGMMVVPEGGALFQHNMSMIVDGHTGIEHAIPIANAYEDVLQLWAKSEVGYTPTLNVAYGGLGAEHYWYQDSEVYAHPRLRRFVPARVLDARGRRPATAPHHEWNHIDVARFAKRLIDAGGRVQVGGHGQREGLGAHWEMWALAQGGFTPHEALRSGTMHGAFYLGLDKDLGSLKPGKLADVALIAGDPLADIRDSEKVRFVIANGRLYDASTMAQLYPDKVAAPEHFFSHDGVTTDAEVRGQDGCMGCMH
ncbi:MAG: amidohydrolase family protein [Myxococcota bacterium]